MNEKNNPKPSTDNPVDRFVIAFDKLLSRFETAITFACFIAMTLLVLAGIVSRFLLHIPFIWVEEASRYLMVAGAFIGISVAARDKSHLGLSFVVDVLPGKAGTGLRIVSEIICIALYSVLFVLSWQFMMQIKGTGTKSPALSSMPMWFVYVPIMVGILLTLIRVIMLFWNDHISRSSPLTVTVEENWAN